MGHSQYKSLPKTHFRGGERGDALFENHSNIFPASKEVNLCSKFITNSTKTLGASLLTEQNDKTFKVQKNYFKKVHNFLKMRRFRYKFSFEIFFVGIG